MHAPYRQKNIQVTYKIWSTLVIGVGNLWVMGTDRGPASSGDSATRDSAGPASPVPKRHFKVSRREPTNCYGSQDRFPQHLEIYLIMSLRLFPCHYMTSWAWRALLGMQKGVSTEF